MSSKPFVLPCSRNRPVIHPRLVEKGMRILMMAPILKISVMYKCKQLVLVIMELRMILIRKPKPCAGKIRFIWDSVVFACPARSNKLGPRIPLSKPWKKKNMYIFFHRKIISFKQQQELNLKWKKITYQMFLILGDFTKILKWVFENR